MKITDFFPAEEMRPGQAEVLPQVEAAWNTSDVIVIEAGTGCHAKGTEILMWDGTTKKVEDIVVGDQLVGPDSKPRNVLELKRGREPMYKIVPVKGEPWVVNLNHILSLEETTSNEKGKIYNISVKNYLRLSDRKKHLLKLYRRGVDWDNTSDLDIDPYLLGLWLGDGSSSAPTFTLSNPALVDYVKDCADFLGQPVKTNSKPGCLEVRVQKNQDKVNVLRQLLEKNNLLGNKHIPQKYLRSGRKTRLQLLAGLLDTDGYCHNAGFEIIAKRDELAKDILTLVRSLGLAAYRSTKLVKLDWWDEPRPYNRINISGDCSSIPTKVKKASERKQIKSVLRTGFSLEPCEVDDFYGFSLDSDHLYLLGDFTVTHNSGKSNILQTIARWRKEKGESTATLVPRVTLQEQYEKSFPDVTVLKGKSRYKCADDLFKSCLEKKEVVGEYCSGCKYSCDRETALISKNSVFSVHSYLMLKSRKEVLLCDEADTLYSIMADQSTVTLWQPVVKYPDNMKEYGEVISWLEKAIAIYEQEEVVLNRQVTELREENAKPVELLPWVTGLKEVERVIRRYNRVLQGIKTSPTDYFIEHVEEPYRGKPAKALRIRPTTLEDSLNWLWPTSKTKKIVLTSATISKEDLAKLGLDKKRVTWITAPEAIPTADRPVKIEFAGNMGYKFQNNSIPKMARKLLELQERHSDTKGLVHSTYGVAEKLKKQLEGHTGFIWHDKNNKEARLKEFKEAPPGAVFVASGMYSGLDLAGPEYGWQAITKVPWPSKADKLIAHWYDTDFDWISWLVIRDVLQASGRVNRYAGDYAVTYLLDTAFGDPRRNRKGILTQFKGKFPKDFYRRLV